MTTLILVKHSLPEIQPNLPANEWHLSPEGRARCVPLAALLTPYAPDVIYTSEEPKAFETGKLLAEQMDQTATPTPNLHEHERQNEPFTTSEDFYANVAQFFSQPDALVFGGETASQALARYRAAVNDLLTRHPAENLIIVSHGTVMTLLTHHLTGTPPYPLWQRLGLPSFIVLAMPKGELITIQEEVI